MYVLRLLPVFPIPNGIEFVSISSHVHCVAVGILRLLLFLLFFLLSLIIVILNALVDMMPVDTRN